MKDIEECFAIEKENHPWATDDIIKRIVKDNMKKDPSYYDEEKSDEMDEEMDYDEEPEMDMENMDPNDPILSITVMKTGKGKKGNDPFPQEKYGR